MFRRHAASVPGVDNGDIVVDTPSPPPKDGLLAAYLRALDRKPIFTKVRLIALTHARTTMSLAFA